MNSYLSAISHPFPILDLGQDKSSRDRQFFRHRSSGGAPFASGALNEQLFTAS